MAGLGGGGEQVIPRTHTEKIEVLFANNTALRRQLEEELPEAGMEGEGQMNVRIGGGADDIAYFNFAEGRKVEQREFAGRQYIIADSIGKLVWKLTGESKVLLGYTCQQAVTTRIGKRFEMSMDNGKMTRKEVPDTNRVTVWFTTSIPVPAGPDFQGQLPGLILEVEMTNGSTVKAVEITEKVDVQAIREPRKGKKVTMEEFNKEREKVMEEMQKNGPARRVLRAN
jgi:GLPGLI family protein